MRQIYTSPRPENIDRVVALMAEHGIEATVANRSNYKRQSYQRFSYSQQQDSRDSWAQVWISRADDYTKARALLREIGIEPVIRHGDELAAARNPSPTMQREHTVARVRRIVLLLVLAAFAMVVLRYLHIV
ncbi:DUF2007 domain-containing protein [Rhodanobacter sp. C05]|uniref:putative signal transducing protein n=1 Tax=Rhodanobacter sp. C05 TaxID=1945855 RepID=UPI0009875EE5|nr:DUF2007 domain-containing protein [Rhodanobacter sp. C05]OOG40851.1 hypothetical protein B0E51_09610 [Rhodanobacter sp. C05]